MNGTVKEFKETLEEMRGIQIEMSKAIKEN